jgi:hypothetical protein
MKRRDFPLQKNRYRIPYILMYNDTEYTDPDPGTFQKKVNKVLDKYYGTGANTCLFSKF